MPASSPSPNSWHPSAFLPTATAHSLAPKVLKHCLQESSALSLPWRSELCRPCGLLPASGSRLLNPAALFPLGSPMITPFLFFPFYYLCTVDFPSQTRKILAEEPQGHSCLSNPIQDRLFKLEFLVWCWKKTTLSTVVQGVLPLLWSCHPQQALAFADRHCSPQMHWAGRIYTQTNSSALGM